MAQVTALAKPSAEATLPVVAVVGATGSGKSEVALDLVEKLSGIGVPAEIVNADAMQLYRGMDIGTAKLPTEARRGIAHHLLDVWEVTRSAAVSDYQSLARAAITDCHARGVVPLLVGGSGLYVSSVLYEFEVPGTDPVIRAQWESRLATEGSDALVAQLRAKDPLAAAAIDPKNERRLVRALEVIELTGKPFGAGLDAQHHPWQSNTLVCGLRIPREELVERLDQRVLGMWRAGLIDEVRGLIPSGIESGVTASRAIGYQQALAHIHGTMTEGQAIEETQSLTRRYARRQVSWFSRDASTTWVDPREDSAVEQMFGLISATLL